MPRFLNFLHALPLLILKEKKNKRKPKITGLHLLNFAFMKFVQIRETKKKTTKATDFAYSTFGQCSQAQGGLGWSCAWPGVGT